ncbi:unnamed protein product [Nippostrongylus brasiliensis]|uniref:Glycosylphosphatidylinositol anchor attachment 1 protein (inferred by orthology to a human protein) n=1 Tax=Nippostrongylus brasiliensis TaxID=27835 RepID=A0A0N4Y1S8_NIPBR|nr:unnamed protein product [Nippostrongylus brasiliensis]
MRALVTSSGQRHRLLQRILDKPGLFSLVFYAAALYYASFILDYKNAEHTRVSEHALMPGLVVERFDKDGLAAQYLQGLREHASRRQDYICRMMEEARILCHMQRWWSTVKVTNVSGTNTYAVLRAPRATGVEAMVFAVDLNQREAVAMVMAYAAFARQQVYWARDLFFVFVDGGAAGMDAWLSEYHVVQHPALRADPLSEMGGVIIGSVVWKSPNSIRVELNHLNGQLPNLDLFNSVVRIAGNGKFEMNTMIYDVRDVEQGGIDWHMLVPLRAIYTQAFTAVEGLHSVMGKYGVQAITVAVPPLNSYPLRKSTRILEAIARALNNVLERFHQSYFLYILASPDNFVSIAYFMPILGGILLPLLIFAYKEWTSLSTIVMPRSLLIMHSIGLLTWCLCTKFFTDLTVDPRSEVVYLGISMLIPWGLIIAPPVTEVRSLRFFLLLECCLATATVSLLNFSLALCFALIAVPVLVKFTQDNDSRPEPIESGGFGYHDTPIPWICRISYLAKLVWHIP